ncbi:chorismate synthase [Clostridium cavendishii DSM 21758]|uniref:Chorismate synthase n=1 Tax=Clostridium cavendishii DSM 21758 TaxID=1121302 RepID=A0A1M6MY98_9CLOT|nr:chorismate synthase [Clostridium cavendishii]SHJ88408.1 chorismate synthase [Clostridium cavendishii DSM 21758]
MSGVWGNNMKISIFGESHGNGIGIVINGLEPGFEIDFDYIDKEMERRAPGRNNLSTARKEADKVEILSGIFEGKVTGAPICAVIKNIDTRSKDYSLLKDVMRPGHADYPGLIRYDGFNDYRGGGHFSGRITAPLVFAGALAKQILEKKGIFIGAHLKSVGKVEEAYFDSINLNKETLLSLRGKELPILEDKNLEKVKHEILSAKMEGDSVGGVVECGIIGLKAGIGDPFFDSVESTIAHLAFSVPGIKGIEFGAGFDYTKMRGSEGNDEYYMDGKCIKTYSNNNGGITGGITNGMPIIFRAAVKPTASIIKEQRTINAKTLEDTKLVVQGRHDPCIAQRALVVIETIAALAILDLIGGK